jgi:hypothetical protein
MQNGRCALIARDHKHVEIKYERNDAKVMTQNSLHESKHVHAGPSL